VISKYVLKPGITQNAKFHRKTARDDDAVSVPVSTTTAISTQRKAAKTQATPEMKTAMRA
jgi:hypothetical protein